MEIKRGIAVSPGVAIGPALVLDSEGYRISERYIKKEEREAEVARLGQALAAATQEALAKQKDISDKAGSHYGAIFAAHAALIGDPELLRELETLIREKSYTAPYAVSRAIRSRAKALESLRSESFSARASDLFDIEKLILRHLFGILLEQLKHLQQPVIVLAHDLTPSETAAMDKMVHAFATEAGGRTSHTAIIAGALEIPAVVGVGRLLTDISGGDEVIVDGTRGVVILNPDEETRERYIQARKRFLTFQLSLEELRTLPAQTSDGVRIELLGNIEFPEETQHCLDRGSDGVGLYRTEFLYLNKSSDPTEADQFDAYLSVLRAMGPKPVVIRTLDLGADKFSMANGEHHHERNPFLGLRSIRLCLRNLTLFKTQIRAILRASDFGDVRIMFPMVSTLDELRHCKMLIADVKEDLEDEGIRFNPKIPIGTMIEVPSAALMAPEMAREVNFFSIGTNDLVQYTLAADRTNETVASLYNPADPAVLRLINLVVQAGKEHHVEVSVCGEMSGEPIYAMLLLGMGLRHLSVTPHNIPEIKKIIRSVTIQQAEQVAQEALRQETARDVNNYLREQTRRILPEVVS